MGATIASVSSQPSYYCESQLTDTHLVPCARLRASVGDVAEPCCCKRIRRRCVGGTCNPTRRNCRTDTATAAAATSSHGPCALAVAASIQTSVAHASTVAAAERIGRAVTATGWVPARIPAAAGCGLAHTVIAPCWYDKTAAAAATPTATAAVAFCSGSIIGIGRPIIETLFY